MAVVTANSDRSFVAVEDFDGDEAFVFERGDGAGDLSFAQIEEVGEVGVAREATVFVVEVLDLHEECFFEKRKIPRKPNLDRNKHPFERPLALLVIHAPYHTLRSSISALERSKICGLMMESSRAISCEIEAKVKENRACRPLLWVRAALHAPVASVMMR
jgi:hypothetical protein